MHKVFALLVLFFVSQSCADDWEYSGGLIEMMYVYPTYMIVVQNNEYSGKSGCGQNNKRAWSFYWSDFDSNAQQRIYSTLLAAKMSQTPIKPIFTISDCGPEGYKKFTGSFVVLP